MLIFTQYGMYRECTKMLENASSIHDNRQDLSEQLFFAYVRENKLLQQ